MTDTNMTMKAWICKAYGSPQVLELARIARPAIGPDGLLIRMQAATVSAGDSRIRAARFPRGFGLLGRLALGLTGPRKKVLGTDVSGTVVEVGAAVKDFKPGDEIVAFPGGTLGCHAEFVAVTRKQPVAAKPDLLNHEEAASLCFGGMTALDYLRKAELKPGETLLVIGATGATGQAFVQLGRIFGAEVDAVCGPRNQDLARELGATAIYDYSSQDFREAGRTWDVIADLSGQYNLRNAGGALKENGRLLVLAGPLSDLFTRRRGTKRQIAGPASEKPEYLPELMALAGQGRLKPVIAGVFDFDDLPKAHGLADTGHKRGSLVVRGPGLPAK